MTKVGLRKEIIKNWAKLMKNRSSKTSSGKRARKCRELLNYAAAHGCSIPHTTNPTHFSCDWFSQNSKISEKSKLFACLKNIRGEDGKIFRDSLWRLPLQKPSENILGVRHRLSKGNVTKIWNFVVIKMSPQIKESIVSFVWWND